MLYRKSFFFLAAEKEKHELFIWILNRECLGFNFISDLIFTEIFHSNLDENLN